MYFNTVHERSISCIWVIINLFFIKFFRVAQNKGVKLNIHHLLLVQLWFIIIISMVKFNQNTNIEFFIEFFWLLIGLIILSFVIVLKGLNSREVLDILVSTSTIMGIIIVTGYFLGFSINHLYSAPLRRYPTCRRVRWTK